MEPFIPAGPAEEPVPPMFLDGQTEFLDGEVIEEVLPPPSPLERLAALMEMQNIADALPDDELGRIGDEAIREYGLDKASMKPWLDRMEKAIGLAKLVRDEKTTPWTGSANVRYPLITTAALQFNARAYPAVVSHDRIVKAAIFGSDPTGLKAGRADRVAEHMSWQLSSQVEEWEEETDKLLTILPIVGTMVRKIWYDPARRRPRSRMVEAGRFVVHDRVRVLGDAPRCSEEIDLYPGEITERVKSGLFRALEDYTEDGEDTEKPEMFIEQHRGLDLDGDGYREPYVVTVHHRTRKVARIVADFGPSDVVPADDGSVASIRRGSYFVAYHFLPSLDGGFFGTGLGLLLGDISETIASIINMMLDAGNMASRGGGFIGAEFGIKGGSHTFRPGEWKLAKVPGAMVKEAIVPLTFPGPDATLFQLLGLLIDAGKDVTSIKDIMTGETGGRTMTATTTMALIEQGMAQFTAAYKRIYRALKAEFRLIAAINAQTVTPEEYNQFHDGPMMFDPAAEYALADMDILPVADPSAVTRMQEMAKAQVIMEASQAGLANPQAAARRLFEAAGIPDVEELLPQPDPMQQQIAAMQTMVMQADLVLRQADLQKRLAEVEETRSKTMKNVADAASTQQAVMLDELRMNLEVVRDGVLGALARAAGGMAASSGQPAGPFGPAPVPGPPAGGGGGGLLVGPGMAGGGAPGAPPAGIPAF